MARATSSTSVRRYTPADLPRIADICRHVYGGTDVLARTIQLDLTHNPAATVLVSHCNSSTQQVQGVVCSEVRGASSFLFGLRVAEEARGNGVAAQLMGAICHHCCTQEGVEHIMSTTVPPNTPAVRIFSRLGFTHCRTVDRWPQEHLQEAYEAAVGFRPNQEQPEQLMHFDATQLNMLDHIPGARQTINQAAAGLQQADWVCCSSLQQLQQAVASIRQQQEQPWQQQNHEYCPPLDWLPWVYEVHALDSTWVQQRLSAGQVWLLQKTHSSTAVQYTAVVVLAHSPLNCRLCAGIIAVQEAGVAAALAFVGSRVPHFVAYIDSGSRHSSGGVDPHLKLPAVLELGRQNLGERDYMCYIVYGREATAQGLPDYNAVSKLYIVESGCSCHANFQNVDTVERRPGIPM